MDDTQKNWITLWTSSSHLNYHLQLKTEQAVGNGKKAIMSGKVTSKERWDLGLAFSIDKFRDLVVVLDRERHTNETNGYSTFTCECLVLKSIMPSVFRAYLLFLKNNKPKIAIFKWQILLHFSGHIEYLITMNTFQNTINNFFTWKTLTSKVK